MFSEKEEVLVFFGGEIKSISELLSEFNVFTSSEGFNGFFNLDSDVLSVHDDIFGDDIEMFDWVLKSFDDVVEHFPVHLFTGYRFANWDSLLEGLNETKGLNSSGDSFLDALVLVSLLNSFSGTFKNHGSAISFIDAE